MALYRYKLIEASGRPSGGLIELPFENELSAMAYLERQGATVIFARLLHPLLARIVAFFYGLRDQRVTRADIAETLSNLAVMLGAGIPVLAALRDTMVGNDNRTIAALGRDMVMRVEGGSSLSDAASYHPTFFHSTVQFLMRIGEESGTLDRTLRDAAEHVRRIDRIIKDTRSALIYPIFVFISIFGALIFWLSVVVPTMQGLFIQLQVPLPALTKWIIAAAAFLEAHYKPIVLTILGLILGFTILIKRSPLARHRFHALLLRTPIIKRVLVAFNLAYISEYFSLLIASGVDILRSLEVLRGTLHNDVYKERLSIVRGGLVQGVTLRQSFAEAGVFPGFVVRMIGVGEETGTLTGQLNYIAEEYRDRLDRLVANIGKIVEPVAILVGGGIFIVMAVGLFMPVYQLVGAVK